MTPEELKDFVLHKLSDMEKHTDTLSMLMEKRLETMNEFRNSLKDQTDKMLTRTEFQIFHDKVLEDIRFLRESRALIEGKASQTFVNITFMFSMISLFIAILNYLK